MEAVLDAATILFAARGPASVSVRDIAKAARINHALVHRHFGSKRAVLRAVLDRTVMNVAGIADKITDPREGMAQLFMAVAEHDNYYRALARAILDGENPRALQRDFPAIHKMINLLGSRRSESRMSAHQHSVRVTDAKFIIGATSALSLGWLLFEPFLLTATGLDEYDHDSVRKCVVRMLQLMVDRADADPAIPSQTNSEVAIAGRQFRRR
jgi:AcrR family transcriptional regulator